MSVDSPTGRLRILLVDDDDDQRRLLRMQFGRAGFDDVTDAADGEGALAAAAATDLDLIVLDLAMPGRSGIDVLPELHELAPGALIVVLSNFPRWRMSELVRRRGAVGYVEKRVRPDRVVREILVAAALTDQAADVVSSRFGAGRTAPRHARQFVREVLHADDGDLLERVELLVSELVTNAVLHASSSPRVDVHLSTSVVRIEVFDDDETLPSPRVPDADSPGGRGLHLLQRIASRWGAEPHDDGKVVWFELDRTASAVSS